MHRFVDLVLGLEQELRLRILDSDFDVRRHARDGRDPAFFLLSNPAKGTLADVVAFNAQSDVLDATDDAKRIEQAFGLFLQAAVLCVVARGGSALMAQEQAAWIRRLTSTFEVR